MTWSATGVIPDPFEAGQKYGVISADPPWQYRDRAEAGRRGAGHKYPLLSNRDVAELPVARIAADDAMLFLWVTWPKLPEVLPVIDAWGFQFRTVAFVWVKRTVRSGALAWGMGSWTRANTEPCLLATRGRPKRVSASVHQVVEAPMARHSEKPGEVRARIVQLAGDVARIELFARHTVPEWDVWGNELDPDSSVAPVVVPELPSKGSREWHTLRNQGLAFLGEHGATTRRDLEAGLGWSRDFTKAVLARLMREGALVRQGRTRSTRYELAADWKSSSEAETQPSQLPLRPRGNPTN